MEFEYESAELQFELSAEILKADAAIKLAHLLESRQDDEGARQWWSRALAAWSAAEVRDLWHSSDVIGYAGVVLGCCRFVTRSASLVLQLGSVTNVLRAFGRVLDALAGVEPVESCHLLDFEAIGRAADATRAVMSASCIQGLQADDDAMLGRLESACRRAREWQQGQGIRPFD